MVSERNRSLALIELLQSKNITINIGKNKARGNNGIFIYKNDNFRIDISKNITESEKIKVILHEYAHFIHYKYDHTLNSLDFIFDNLTDDENEELLKITIEKIPTTLALKLCNKKEKYKSDIKYFTKLIRNEFHDFNATKKYNKIEKKLPKLAKLLLKHDLINYNNQLINLVNICTFYPNLNKNELNYIKLFSTKRKLNRINNRISKLNNYYNKPTELFARFIETYFVEKNKCLKLAPLLTQKIEKIINNKLIYELNEINDIFE